MKDLEKIENNDVFLAKSKIAVKENQLVATWLYQKTANTRAAYESDIKLFFDFLPGLNLIDIRIEHLGEYLQSKSHMKPATQARIKASLSSLFKFMVKVQYLDKNPCEGLDSIKVPDQTQFRVLSHEEIVRMVAMEENPRNKAIIRLLYKSGIRVSELCGLKLSNLVERDGEYYLIVVGKGSKTRTIPLDNSYFRDLREQMSDGSQYIFTSRLGGALSRKAVWEIIKKSAKKSKVNPSASPHWARHGHATTSLKQGSDLREIQSTLGHDSIRTTVKYTKVSPKQSSSYKIDI